MRATGGTAVTIVLLVATACGSSSPDTAAIGRCVDGFESLTTYDGLPESDALAQLAASSTQVRVIGRDEECLARTDDLVAERVNLYVYDGVVVRAGRG